MKLLRNIALLAVASVLLPAVASASGTTSSYVATAVNAAVLAGQDDAPVPSVTTPTLAAAAGDQVNIGACNAWRVTRSHICQFGDPTGKRTVIVFGNSHSNMWIPAISVAAKTDHWKFYPIVKNACGYGAYVNTYDAWGPNNQCAIWYAWALQQIARLHPSVIIVGSYTANKYWAQGEATVINKLKTIAPRIILFSDTPTIPAPGGCLMKPGVTQGSCLWPVASSVAAFQRQTTALAASEKVNYLNVTDWFCDGGLCPSVINDIIPYKDGAHVTPQYSRFLGPAMASAINLNGNKVIPPTSVALATPTTSTTTP